MPNLSNESLTRHAFKHADKLARELTLRHSHYGPIGTGRVLHRGNGHTIFQVKDLPPDLFDALAWLRSRNQVNMTEDSNGLTVTFLPAVGTVPQEKYVVIPAHSTIDVSFDPRDAGDGPAFAVSKLDRRLVDWLNQSREFMDNHSTDLVVRQHPVSWDGDESGYRNGVAFNGDAFWMVRGFEDDDVYEAVTEKINLNDLEPALANEQKVLYFQDGQLIGAESVSSLLCENSALLLTEFITFECP